ncbi:hypothetical protein B0H14DRAFT_2631087 [Mycena olivaceomarginata]|nr:hypothetical protein B0H14DRAFT_2631087 [Mycena olivaceomarginata]
MSVYICEAPYTGKHLSAFWDSVVYGDEEEKDHGQMLTQNCGQHSSAASGKHRLQGMEGTHIQSPRQKLVQELGGLLEIAYSSRALRRSNNVKKLIPAFNSNLVRFEDGGDRHAVGGKSKCPPTASTSVRTARTGLQARLQSVTWNSAGLVLESNSERGCPGGNEVVVEWKFWTSLQWDEANRSRSGVTTVAFAGSRASSVRGEVTSRGRVAAWAGVREGEEGQGEIGDVAEVDKVGKVGLGADGTGEEDKVGVGVVIVLVLELAVELGLDGEEAHLEDAKDVARARYPTVPSPSHVRSRIAAGAGGLGLLSVLRAKK